jgi:very-short-patch-repair endonuclease
VVKKDKAENAYLNKCGYKVVRIPEKEVSNFSVALFINELKAGSYNYKEVNNIHYYPNK